MAIITKAIKLETTKQNLIQAVIAKQNDCNSRFLKVTFLDEGNVIPLDSSSSVTINAERKDGASDSFFGEVNEDDTATVPLHSWILELDGEVICDVSIMDTDGRRLTTTSFVVKVEKAACSSDDIIIHPEYNVLVNLIQETEEINQEVIQAREELIAAKQSFASAIKGKATGNPLSPNDISSISHELKVSVSPKGSVTKYTENFIPSTHNYAVGEKKTSNGVTFVDHGNNTITADGVNTGSTSNYYIYDNALKKPIPAGNYIFYGCGEDGKPYNSDAPFKLRLTLWDKDGNKTYIESNRGARKVEFTLDKPMARMQFGIRIMQGVAVVQQKFHTLLLNKDMGIVYAPNNDGTVEGILSENTAVLMAENGSTITAEYNKDTNKVIESLVNAILSLGGYV